MTRYQAAGGKILVLLDPQEALSAGGIIIPEVAQAKSVTGVVTSVGPEVREDLTDGDRVILASAYAGSLVKDGAHSSHLVAVTEDEILAIFADYDDPWRFVESAVK